MAWGTWIGENGLVVMAGMEQMERIQHVKHIVSVCFIPFHPLLWTILPSTAFCGVWESFANNLKENKRLILDQCVGFYLFVRQLMTLTMLKDTRFPSPDTLQYFIHAIMKCISTSPTIAD
jgi:hypothetical protein